MAETKTCQQVVLSGRWHRPCGRPVKGDGDLCATHAAAVKRRKTNDARRQSEWARRTAVQERSEEAKEALKALGVDALSTEHGVLLPPDVAEALIERLRRLGAETG